MKTFFFDNKVKNKMIVRHVPDSMAVCLKAVILNHRHAQMELISCPSARLTSNCPDIDGNIIKETDL